jgi:hypothetical protein
VHSLNKEANEKHNATEVIILNTCFMDKLANKLKLKTKKKNTFFLNPSDWMAKLWLLQ